MAGVPLSLSILLRCEDDNTKKSSTDVSNIRVLPDKCVEAAHRGYLSREVVCG